MIHITMSSTLSLFATMISVSLCLQQATDATGDGPKPAATVDPKEVERLNAEITKQVRYLLYTV